MRQKEDLRSKPVKIAAAPMGAKPVHQARPMRTARRPAPAGPPIPASPPPEAAPPPYAPAPGQRVSIAVVGRFRAWPWGQHPDEAYLADGLEAAGAQVARVDQTMGGRPDCDWALFTGQPGSYGKIKPWGMGPRAILWTLDWLPGYPEREPIIRAGKSAAVFSTSDRYDWRSRGLDNHFYLPGACEGVIPKFSPEPTRSCAFIGSLYSERRRAIAELVRKLGGEVLDSSGKWVYGLDLAKFVQGTKVVVGDNAVNDVDGYWSSRNYVVPGAGGFLLTPRVPGLERHLAHGKHAALYGDMGDLEVALKRWVSDDPAREEARCAGFLHVRENHNWEARARALLAHLAARAAANAGKA